MTTCFAFSNVTVLPMTGAAAMPAHTVIVADGTIARVGPLAEVPIPEHATMIDGTGRTLLPGLCDMHVHIGATDMTAPDTGLSAEETLRRFRDYIAVFPRFGVTTVRNMAGSPAHLRLRAEVAEGTTLGPRIFTSGPILETRFTWPGLAAIGQLVTSVPQAWEIVRAHRRDGYDFVKVYNDIDADIYDALVAASREAGLPIIGHVAFAKGLDGALAARQDSIEHLRSYDFAADTRAAPPGRRFEGWLHSSPERLAELAARTKAAGVVNVPTLVTEGGEMEDLPPGLPGWLAEMLTRMRASCDASGLFTAEQMRAITEGAPHRAAMVAALDRAGAGLLPGSDCPIWGLLPGRSLLREIEMFVAAGVSPLRALEAATIRAAEFLGVSDDSGSIEPGKRADLLLLDADPLAAIGSLRRQAGVMARGRWLPSPAER